MLLNTSEAKRDIYKKVDIIITAFERNHLLVRLINSIRKKYPEAYITVADQSREKFRTEDKKVRVIDMPFDCGLSKARNELIKETERPYVLLLEDDFIFREDTDIEKMLILLEAFPEAGVVGGRVLQLGYPILFEFKFRKEGETLYQVPDGEEWKEYQGIKYKKTGCVTNFALFRRELFKDVQWDDRLKLREHTDFYYRLEQTNWDVLLTNEVKIDDGKERGWPNKEYRDFKARDDFWAIVLKKHGLKKVKYLNGYCIKLSEYGTIIKENEPPERFNKL
jgi:glycosyltransferase involved in cell wall biosynthesis